MKSFLLLLSLVVVFASCSSAYKSGQTPDDVYFSPERPKYEYVRVEKDDDRRYRGQDYYSYEDDRYLRMKVRDRYRWSYLDDYYRDPYAYNYYGSNYYSSNYYYNGYLNPRSYWNCYYNPYAPSVVVVNPKAPVYNKPRMFNLHVFDDPRDNGNPKGPGTRSKDYYTPRQQSSATRDLGNSLRSVFGSSERGSPSKSSSSSSSTNSSSNSGSKSSGSSGSSSGGGNAPVRRF
jgi:uncharacterized membrane protein YgcG